MELIASGRDGDIYAFAPGLVLRKTRDGRSIAHEGRIMQYLEGRGYPVPHVEEVRADGTEIVMERIDGPLMMNAMLNGLGALRRGGQTLADLHDQLHAIPAPEWLPSLEEGDRMLHLDLHPLNVIVSPARGPVVIDWGNARGGDGLTDVAVTYALLVGPRMPAPRVVAFALDPVRKWLANQFVLRYRGPQLNARIAYAAELKTLDANMSPDEVKRLQRLARKAAKAPG